MIILTVLVTILSMQSLILILRLSSVYDRQFTSVEVKSLYFVIQNP